MQIIHLRNLALLLAIPVHCLDSRIPFLNLWFVFLWIRLVLLLEEVVQVLQIFHTDDRHALDGSREPLNIDRVPIEAEAVSLKRKQGMVVTQCSRDLANMLHKFQ